MTANSNSNSNSNSSSTSSPTSKPKTDKRFLKIVKTMKKRFSQHKYYEGQQLLRTIFARLQAQERFEEASELLSEGALILMKHCMIEESVAIVSDLVAIWQQQQLYVLTEQRARYLHELLAIMVSYSAPLSSASSLTSVNANANANTNTITNTSTNSKAPDVQSINNLMKYVITWVNSMIDRNTNQANANSSEISSSSTSISEMERDLNLDAIHTNMQCLYATYGVYLRSTRAYHRSVAALVRITDISPMVAVFNEWAQESPAVETPFFMTRIVLQYLFIGNVQSARAFLTQVCPRDPFRGPTVRHPLANFCDLMVEAIERKNIVLYNVVRREYQSLLMIDSQFIPLIDQAAYQCLGIPLPKKGRGGLLGNIMSLLS